MTVSYGKLSVSEAELSLLLNALTDARSRAFENWKHSESEEKAFYSSWVDRYDALICKMNQPFLDDRSSDAEPDEEEA